MLNLIKVYIYVSTQDFVMFIKNKRCAWEEGAPLNDETLMTNALNKYQVMIQDGTWNAPDKRDQKIFALEAEVKELSRNANRAMQPGKTQKPRGKRDDESGAWAWKKVKHKMVKVQRTSGRRNIIGATTTKCGPSMNLPSVHWHRKIQRRHMKP
jgi:hypothetical protein